MNKKSLNSEELSKIDSKHGFFEVFNDKKIKKSFHNMKNHNMNKKYVNKIPFHIVETIAFDKGQFLFWVFTDSQGYVMRRSNKKLNRLYLLDYFLNIIIEFFRIEEGYKFNKSFSQIVTDINRFSSQDEKLDEKLIQSDPSYSYLQKFINLNNFHLVYSPESLRKTRLVNIFEFNKIINDGTMLSSILLIQNYLYLFHKYKPLVFKYTKKSDLAPKKVFLMTEGPVKNFGMSNNNFEDCYDTLFFNYNHNEDEIKIEQGLININDNNLCMQIDNVLEPFIKLIEKSYNIIIREGKFKLLRFRQKISEDNKGYTDYIVYTFCNSVTAVDKTSDNYQKNEIEMKGKMNLIREKNLPRDLKNSNFRFQSNQNKLSYINNMNMKNFYGEGQNRLRNYSMTGIYRKIKNNEKSLNSLENDKKNILGSTNSTKYEYAKIPKSSFCFGEFCEYTIPEVFKHLKKNQKLEMLTTRIPIENKISTRDKLFNLPNSLPTYLIKKAYDNPDMVDIVLKAYSIFPKDFDKEKAIKRIEQSRKEEEERRKEREKREEEEIKRIEDERKKMQFTVSLPSIPNENYLKTLSSISKEKNLNLKQSNKESVDDISKNSISSNNPEEDASSSRFKKNNGITLYVPDPKKFRQFNYDLMYSEKYVCNNCFVVYIIIESFLSNIDSTTSQFKSLKKAREILFLGDKLKIPYNEEDSLGQDQTENLLFQEEKSDFNLKYILKRNLNKWKKDAMEQIEKRKSNPKIEKKPNNKKSEFLKAFSYNLDVNPKLLKFNLIAEKTKNNFFNLIFNELKNKPESIYEKLGIDRNNKNFPKSMTTLRMHMGINSLGYNIKEKDLEKLNEKFADKTSRKEFEKIDPSDEKNELNDIEKSFKKNKNIPHDFFQVDVDLFLAYKNLKRKFWTVNLNYGKNIFGDGSYALEGLNDLDNNHSFSKSQIALQESLNISNDKVLTNIKSGKEKEKAFIKNLDDTELELTKIEKFDENDKLNPPSLKFSEKSNFKKASRKNLKTSILPKDKNENDLISKTNTTENNITINPIKEIKQSSEEIANSKSNLIKRQLTSLKNRITFNLDTAKEISDKSQKKIFTRSITTQSHRSKIERGQSIDQKNDKINLKNHSLENSRNHEDANIITRNCLGKSIVKKKTNPDLFVSNLGIGPKCSIKQLDNLNNHNNQVIKEENQVSLDYLEKISNETKDIGINESKDDSKNFTVDNMTNKSSINPNESRKVTVSSICYHDWNKESNNFEIFQNHYYHITTPLTKFNEINTVVNENPLEIIGKMSMEDYIKLGKFSHVGNLLNENSKIFIYDQFTAVPFKIKEIKSRDKIKENSAEKNLTREDEVKKNLTSRQFSVANLKDFQIKEGKLLVIVLNDFYDSFMKYEDTLTDLWSKNSEMFEILNLVFFNFPGQSGTFFPKKAIFNNIYYSEFLDRFIFYLMEKGIFDNTYHLILVGFGNGGQVAMTYASCYEKYWDFLHSIILFNTYCENDDYINKSMLEILKIIDSTKNQKLVNFFVKSVTVNPQKLLDIENNMNVNDIFEPSAKDEKDGKSLLLDKFNFNKPSKIEDDSLGITSTGIYNITKGYFYNMKINLKEISTPIVLVHSNQNCFITLNNINGIISNSNIRTEQILMTENNLGITENNLRKAVNECGKKNSDVNYKQNIKINLCDFEINQKKEANYLLYSSNTNKNYQHSEIDFSEILPNNKTRRKFIIVDGSHDLILENSQLVVDIINSYISYVKKYMPSPLFGDK